MLENALYKKTDTTICLYILPGVVVEGPFYHSVNSDCSHTNSLNRAPTKTSSWAIRTDFSEFNAGHRYDRSMKYMGYKFEKIGGFNNIVYLVLKYNGHRDLIFARIASEIHVWHQF